VRYQRPCEDLHSDSGESFGQRQKFPSSKFIESKITVSVVIVVTTQKRKIVNSVCQRCSRAKSLCDCYSMQKSEHVGEFTLNNPCPLLAHKSTKNPSATNYTEIDLDRMFSGEFTIHTRKH
jgi:hypothetical protein